MLIYINKVKKLLKFRSAVKFAVLYFINGFLVSPLFNLINIDFKLRFPALYILYTAQHIFMEYILYLSGASPGFRFGETLDKKLLYKDFVLILNTKFAQNFKKFSKKLIEKFTNIFKY